MDLFTYVLSDARDTQDSGLVDYVLMLGVGKFAANGEVGFTYIHTYWVMDDG